MLTGLLILFAVIYLTPTILGALLGVRGLGVIFLVNVFLGWTIAGWAVALMWVAQRSDTRQAPRLDMRRDEGGRYVAG